MILATLPYQMQKIIPPDRWIYICWFTFIENAISNSPKVPRAKFLGSDGLFCFVSISKFCSFKNPFATITSLYELPFRFRFVGTNEKVISTNYGSSRSSWKPWRWVSLDLISMTRYINSNLSPLIKFTGRTRSTEFKNIFPSNIFQMIKKTVPNRLYQS